jgi:hypothetical protein
MTAHARKVLDRVPTAFNILPDEGRSEVTAKRVPRRLYIFIAVERMLPGNALSPSFDAFRMHRNQKDATARRTTKARLEEVHERHVNFAKCYRFYLQLVLIDR